jgi:hypothetical protein
MRQWDKNSAVAKLPPSVDTIGFVGFPVDAVGHSTYFDPVPSVMTWGCRVDQPRRMAARARCHFYAVLAGQFLEVRDEGRSLVTCHVAFSLGVIAPQPHARNGAA